MLNKKRETKKKADFVREFSDQTRTNVVFFDASIARRCPRLMRAAFGARYLDRLVVVKLDHVNRNMELTNRWLNACARELTGLPHIEMLRANYIRTSALYALNFPAQALRADQLRSDVAAGAGVDSIVDASEAASALPPVCNEVIVYNTIPFIVYADKYVLCSRTYESQSQLSVYHKALVLLMRRYCGGGGGNQDNVEEEEARRRKAKAAVESIASHLLDEYNWTPWQLGSNKSDLINMDEIVFPSFDDDTNSNSETIYFIGGGKQQATAAAAAIQADLSGLDTPDAGDEAAQRRAGGAGARGARGRGAFMKVDHRADDEIFGLRVRDEREHAVNELLNADGSAKRASADGAVNEDTPARSVALSTERQRHVGVRAEHYFSVYLRSKYGESYNESDSWKSSAQSRVYHHQVHHGCDDTLGYDFVIRDNLNLFASAKSTKDSNRKTCYIEV